MRRWSISHRALGKQSTNFSGISGHATPPGFSAGVAGSPVVACSTRAHPLTDGPMLGGDGLGSGYVGGEEFRPRHDEGEQADEGEVGEHDDCDGECEGHFRSLSDWLPLTGSQSRSAASVLCRRSLRAR